MEGEKKSEQIPSLGKAFGKLEWGLLGIVALSIVYFYGFHGIFIEYYGASAFDWLSGTWNARNELQHGWLMPLLIGFILWRQRDELAAIKVKPSNIGLLVVLVGVLFYLVAARTMQQRIAVGSFPIVVVGSALYLWGWKAARLLAFPFFLIYLVVPIPGLTQATNGLSILSTQGAYFIVSALGVDAVMSGNNINSASGTWGFNVAEGCSGIRSLLAMTLIGAVFAYVTQKEFWKKAALFLSSFPLAMIANMFRIASIVLIAKYGSEEFAGNLYHDYSAFIFFPVGLLGLLACNKLLNFSESFSKQKIQIVRNPEAKQTDA